jgi:hypothetical protein
MNKIKKESYCFFFILLILFESSSYKWLLNKRNSNDSRHV